jgi:hypothetical protein
VGHIGFEEKVRLSETKNKILFNKGQNIKEI